MNTSTAPVKKRRTTKGERTKERILDAALKLFSASGSNGVSLRAIAKEAGISHAGLLRYFKNKDELIVSALAHRDDLSESKSLLPERVLPKDADEPFGPKDYVSIFLKVIEQNSHSPGTVGVFVKTAAEATNPDHPAHQYFKKRYTDITDKMTDSFAAILQCSENEAHSRATEFIAFVDGIQLQWLLWPDTVDMLQAAQDYLRRTGIIDSHEDDPQ
ncbi:TetR/AcrR family transcriptional regulator [Bifidobacterium sp. ESL0764]|uniref:TetR/AcrR family transcriptional regulator n=1 Tax=Bifidobacterium sp. ESL0764 TaxID=2983228 RepID=UPI0023F98494|nr:TetR/AcrR family transcriptional regulator [Bifidobacterium sp. ESL0764]WEV65213.1 TetR/AcrR family transcriptional regulator [Bifidobacterium sp. ESL0764]